MRNKLLENWNELEEKLIVSDTKRIIQKKTINEAVDNQTMRNLRKYLKQGITVIFDVESSALSQVEYNPKKELLTLTFANGRVYEYYKVKKNTIVNLAKAQSHGNFFNLRFKRNGRDRFDYEEVS